MKNDGKAVLIVGSINKLAKTDDARSDAYNAKAKREFGPDVLIEAGPALLQEFLKDGLVDQLEISITPVTGGDHLIDLNDALRGFEITEDRKVEDTRFVTAKKR